MEVILVFILIAWAILFFVVFPVWAISSIHRQQRKVDDALSEIRHLRELVFALQSKLKGAPQQSTVADAPQQGTQAPPAVTSASEPRARPTPPPIPPRPPAAPPEMETNERPTPPNAQQPVSPPPFQGFTNQRPHINWERFMGVNLFAWIGGFVLFLAAAFFVKYSIDNNLISPEIRVAIGFLLAIALVVVGLQLNRRQFKVTGQTLCATGIVILYADLYAAHSFYAFINQTSTFLLMILTTAAAIVLAVTLDAKVVALLGLLGGFVTPFLLSTGQDRPLALFGYLGFLDAGLILVALKKRWAFLVLLAAAATLLMQIAWVAAFFNPSKVFVAMTIAASFQALFTVVFFVAGIRRHEDSEYPAAVIILAFSILGFILYLLSFPALGANPWLVFAFALISSVALVAISFVRPSLLAAHHVSGILIFLLLAIWTAKFLTPALLYPALGLYLIFAALQTFSPILIYRKHPEETRSGWDGVYAPFALGLIIFLLFSLAEIPLAIWVWVMVLNGIAIWNASRIRSRVSLFVSLALTWVSLFIWLMRMPPASGPIGFLSITTAFSAAFFGGGILARRKSGMETEDTAFQIPVLAVVMPFVLMISAIIHLRLENPTPVFGLALLLAGVLLAAAVMLRMGVLAMVALLCVGGVEYTWHFTRFNPAWPLIPLGWNVLFYLLFAAFPFLFRRHFAEQIAPWAAAAVSGPLHFYIVYQVVTSAYPNQFMGLLPLAFALPALGGLILRVHSLPHENANARNAQLAWFGAVTLFFITLIFPVQFEHEWILIGWALEGVALLWLFHRIPHAGLRIIGVALLVVVFVLLVNPAFFKTYPRGAFRIFNWYMYTYGIVVAALMAGARLLQPPNHQAAGVPLQGVLYALGTVLAFLLMNIEIADYYSNGKYLNFQFSGNFARDMTYSIAWASFAFTLLIVGIRERRKLARYGSIGLIAVTLTKVFFHDLAELKQLYRVGALVGVAIILILASYLYQRFVSFDEEETA